METVNNLTSAASRAIWGDSSNTSNTETTQTQNETQGREPLSGETGDVAAGEPYDKGNTDSTATEPTALSTTDSTDPTSTTTTNPSSTSEPTTKSDIPNNPIRSEHDTAKTGVTSIHNPTSATSSDPPTSSADTSADPASAQQPTQKQQGADRPGDEPSEGSAEHERIKEAKKEAEEAQGVDVSGPGPRTLEERAKEGGAGGSEVGKGEDGPQKESQGEGTGEKYVKSNGVKADGGDFDASNPGAGKEADRLLEAKGVHHTPGSGAAEPSEEAENGDGKEKKEKMGLRQKIKAKLHKN